MSYAIILLLASATLLITDLMIGTVYLFLMGVSLGLASAAAFLLPYIGFAAPLWLLICIILGSQSLLVWQLHQEDSFLSLWLQRLKDSKDDVPDDFDIGNSVKELVYENNALTASYLGSFWQARLLTDNFDEYRANPAAFDAVIAGKDGNILLLKLLEKRAYLSDHNPSASINIPIGKN